MNLPNFLVIGAGKSGTTSLYEYLRQHPQIFMSPVKETNFFALEGEDISPKHDPDQRFHYPWSVTNLSDYQRLFEDAKDSQAIGEISPMYLYSEKAARNIKHHIPDIKLIVILRQPVDRLYSRFMHLTREQRAPSKDFADSLDRSTIWWKRNDLVREGFYYSHLSHYFNLFSENQIKIVLYEDFNFNTQLVMHELFEFIGVDPSFEPKVGTTFNASGVIVNRRLDRLIGQNSILKKRINSISPGLLKLITQNATLKRLVTRFRNRNLYTPNLDLSLKSKIYSEIYQEDVNNLERLLKRNLGHWEPV